MEDGPSGFPQGFTCPAVLRNRTREPLSFRLRGCHPVSPIVPDRSTKRSVCHSPAPLQWHQARPYNTAAATSADLTQRRFRLIPLRSPLLGESRLLSFPPGTEMVHFPGLASPPYWIQMAISRIALEGLPHSEIFGSKPVCGSPKLIAAYHVLHRRPAPRHPPYALSSLTTAFTLLKNAVVVRTTSLRAITSESSVVNEPRARSSRSGAASDTTARASPKGSSSADVRPRLSGRLVELTGLEPATPWLQTRCSPS